MKGSGSSVQSFHQSYPSQCAGMEARVCMCVCVCARFTSHIHHGAPSPGLCRRLGGSLEGLGCRLQRCPLTKHLSYKINASRLPWVLENPGRLAFAAIHLISITRRAGPMPAESYKDVD